MQTRSGTAACGAVEIFYEDLGEPADPPVLLIMGVGAQLPMWPDGFCDRGRPLKRRRRSLGAASDRKMPTCDGVSCADYGRSRGCDPVHKDSEHLRGL